MWVSKMQDIIGKPVDDAGKDYFTDYEIVEHIPVCPDESIDLFTLPEM